MKKYSVYAQPNQCIIFCETEANRFEACSTTQGLEAAKSIARILNAHEDLVSVMKTAAQRLLDMEAAEIEGDVPRGSDCGHVARRLLNALSHHAGV